MIEKLSLYHIKCDKCNEATTPAIAAIDEDTAIKLAEPYGWSTAKNDAGGEIHLCAPCDGREWPGTIDHFH